MVTQAGKNRLASAAVMILLCSTLCAGCSFGNVEQPVKSQSQALADNTASVKNTEVKPELPKAASDSSSEKKSNQEVPVKTDSEKTEENKEENRIAQKEEKDSKRADTAAVPVACSISGKKYTDISSDMSVLDVLKKVAGRIPKINSYAESNSSKYHHKEAGQLLTDQGCEILWEFELREAGGYDPDKYYLLRIKESGGRILSVTGSMGWDEPFPSALPDAKAAGIVQEPAPYDLLGLK